MKCSCSVCRRENWQCIPICFSVRTEILISAGLASIGEAVRMSENTVRKYIRQLEERGLITTEPTEVITKTGEKRNGNLLFTVRPIQEAVEQFYQQQMEKISLDVQRKKASGTKVRQERPA